MAGNANASESTPFVIDLMRKTKTNEDFVERILQMEKNIIK